jgi:hypothetical protein
MFCSAGNFDFSGVPPDMFCADAVKGVARVAVPNIAITIIAARNIWFIAIGWYTRYLKDQLGFRLEISLFTKHKAFQIN